MSDDCLEESPRPEHTARVDALFIAQARCPSCDAFPMIQLWEGCLLCPKCRKQYYEGPNHNFVRHVYEFTTGAQTNSFFKVKNHE